jgi:hypothetical protein
MSKAQKGNREAKKPKQEKKVVLPPVAVEPPKPNTRKK